MKKTNLECDPPRDVDGGRYPECGSPLLERVAGVEEEPRGERCKNSSEVCHRVGDAHDDPRVQGCEVQHAEGERKSLLLDFARINFESAMVNWKRNQEYSGNEEKRGKRPTKLVLCMWLAITKSSITKFCKDFFLSVKSSRSTWPCIPPL